MIIGTISLFLLRFANLLPNAAQLVLCAFQILLTSDFATKILAHDLRTFVPTLSRELVVRSSLLSPSLHDDHINVSKSFRYSVPYRVQKFTPRKTKVKRYVYCNSISSRSRIFSLARSSPTCGFCWERFVLSKFA